MEMERTELQSVGDLKRSRELSAQRQQPPTEIPGYVPERFLGEGAYGEVWVATEVNTGRKVAIKFYTHRGGLDWSLLSREVEKLAFLFADRYVVQLVDVGWDASPPYYVMEYIEHGSLDELLQREGTLPVDEAVTLFREIAIGLVHSHNKGVLHCDLKPANILLDQDTRPRLCDFGQSRLSHEQSPALGTLFYMAPEQADLKAVPDARWDVYALGALLFCMLTGSPPYRTADNIERIEGQSSLKSRLAAYRAVIEQSPKPTLHRSVPGVDRHLADIIDRCLSPNPKRRFENVQTVIEELASRSRRRARRPLLVLGAIGPAILLVVLGLIGYQTFSAAMETTEETMITSAQQNNLRTAMFVSEAVAGHVERRWQVLREEALSSELIQALKELEGGDEEAIQERLALWTHDTRQNHEASLPTASWFIDDAKGIQHAIDPRPKPTADNTIIQTVGRSWAHRDYFHGMSRDFVAEDLQEDPEDGTIKNVESGEVIRPITQPHLSIVFRSKSSGKRKVAFSVPIFDPDAPPDAPQVIGVLGMTVDLGKFSELEREFDQTGQTIVLVDSKNDSPDPTQGRDPRPGSILEHPSLNQDKAIADRANVSAAGDGSAKTDAQHIIQEAALTDSFFLTDEQTVLLKKLAASRGTSLSEELREFQLQTNYRDPVRGNDAAELLAAIVPIDVYKGEGEFGSTGWAVVVQQQPEKALEPLVPLRNRLLTQGLIALVSVAVVLLGMWGMVYSITGNARGRFLQRFRKLPFGSGSGTGLSTRSSRMGRTPGRQNDKTDNKSV